jgi:hypothetical protein
MLAAPCLILLIKQITTALLQPADDDCMHADSAVAVCKLYIQVHMCRLLKAAVETRQNV